MTGWFGYGRWDAPYWFVGMEPGGDDEACWYESWARLGATELSDCRDHHIGAHYFKWHYGDRPPTQPTWRRLIQLLLGYEGKPSDLNAVSAYQRDQWGRSHGDTALIEVSALRARHCLTQIDRSTHRTRRIEIISARALEFPPIFIVFYGESYRAIYEHIIRTQFDKDGNAYLGKTLCVLVVHPVGRSIASDLKCAKGWVERGVTMKQFTDGPFKTDVIRLLTEKNPKLPTSQSFRRFECYRDRMSFGDYAEEVLSRFGEAEARKCKADLQWDSSRGFIGIERGGRRINLPVPPSLSAP